jgi:hypothetical protein
MTVNGTASGANSGNYESFDPSRGYSYQRIFRGTEQYCRSIIPTLSSDQAWTLDGLNSPVWTLTVMTPDYDGAASSSSVVITYELPGNMIQRSLWEHPRAIAIEADTKTRIKTAIANEADVTGAALSGDALLVYNALRNGQDSFAVGQYVFRINQTISTRNQLSISYDNTLELYTSAQVISETGATGIYATAITNAEASYPFDVPSGSSLRWLKQPPSITGTAGNRVTVSIEYWLEAWSTLFYNQKS